jgi:hypothetical protein
MSSSAAVIRKNQILEATMLRLTTIGCRLTRLDAALRADCWGLGAATATLTPPSDAFMTAKQETVAGLHRWLDDKIPA